MRLARVVPEQLPDDVRLNAYECELCRARLAQPRFVNFLKWRLVIPEIRFGGHEMRRGFRKGGGPSHAEAQMRRLRHYAGEPDRP